MASLDDRKRREGESLGDWEERLIAMEAERNRPPPVWEGKDCLLMTDAEFAGAVAAMERAALAPAHLHSGSPADWTEPPLRPGVASGNTSSTARVPPPKPRDLGLDARDMTDAEYAALRDRLIRESGGYNRF